MITSYMGIAQDPFGDPFLSGAFTTLAIFLGNLDDAVQVCHEQV